MPARSILNKEWLRSYRLGCSVILLTMVSITSYQGRAGTLSNSNGVIETNDSARYSGSVIHPNGDGGTVAIGIRATLHAGLVDGRHTAVSSKVLKEIGKQAIDQPGHFLIAAAPIWASRWLVGVPWYGWVAAPLLAYREWLQWPSNRWWDPPLDWIFLSSGAVVATFRRRRAHRLPHGLQPLGRLLARGLWFLLATGRRTKPAAT
jgi:hypothetical protein